MDGSRLASIPQEGQFALRPLNVNPCERQLLSTEAQQLTGFAKSAYKQFLVSACHFVSQHISIAMTPAWKTVACSPRGTDRKEPVSGARTPAPAVPPIREPSVQPTIATQLSFLVKNNCQIFGNLSHSNRLIPHSNRREQYNFTELHETPLVSHQLSITLSTRALQRNHRHICLSVETDSVSHHNTVKVPEQWRKYSTLRTPLST